METDTQSMFYYGTYSVRGLIFTINDLLLYLFYMETEFHNQCFIMKFIL